jgi:hypothetical protein
LPQTKTGKNQSVICEGEVLWSLVFLHLESKPSGTQRLFDSATQFLGTYADCVDTTWPGCIRFHSALTSPWWRLSRLHGWETDGRYHCQGSAEFSGTLFAEWTSSFIGHKASSGYCDQGLPVGGQSSLALGWPLSFGISGDLYPSTPRPMVSSFLQ